MHTHTGHQSLSALGSHTLLAVATLTIMVGCVIVPGLPAVAAQLGVGSGGSWLVTLPALGVVLFGPAAARLMERAGLRRALMLGLFLYGLLGAAGPYLRGAWLIYADRLLLGGATALVMAAGTGLISTFYTGRARLAMIARQGMAIELGGCCSCSPAACWRNSAGACRSRCTCAPGRCWRWFISACRHSGRSAHIRRIDRSACICHTHRIDRAPSRRPDRRRCRHAGAGQDRLRRRPAVDGRVLRRHHHAARPARGPGRR